MDADYSLAPLISKYDAGNCSVRRGAASGRQAATKPGALAGGNFCRGIRTDANDLRSAECTHNHPEGIKGAQATALAVYLARIGADKESIRQRVQKEFGYDLSRRIEETFSAAVAPGTDPLLDATPAAPPFTVIVA